MPPDQKGVDRRLATLPSAAHKGSKAVLVIEFEDNWFLITAGHILNDLDKLLAHGGRIHESNLFDGWSGRSAQAPAIPFNYADAVLLQAVFNQFDRPYGQTLQNPLTGLSW